MIYLEILLLIILTFQDFKDRAISVWVFVALFLFKSISIVFLNVEINWLSSIINIVYVSIIVLCVFLYYFIKYKSNSIQQLQNSVGLGDVIIVVYFMLILPSVFFIFFIQLSILLSLVMYVMLRKLILKKEIPFAGYISLFYVFLVLISQFTNKNLINDVIVLEWLNRLL